MARNFNFLQGYAEYTKEAETPDSYHLWIGMAALSSVVRRNIWLDQSLYILYPNLYIILVGPPGLGKSTAIRLSRELLVNVDDLTFGPDSLTREELIRFMSNAGSEGKQSAVTIHSTELSSLIEPSKIAMIQFLIDIFDSQNVWRYSTKHQGRNVIHGPFLNIVCGTVPKYLADDFPVQVIGNGFTARTIFVYEDEPRFPNPFPKPADPDLVQALIEDLQHISTLYGAFRWDPEAHRLYEEQYNKIFHTKPSDYRLEDFHFRKKIHLLKVAMLLSIAERDDLILLPQDLITAWDILGALEASLPKTFSAVGKYEYASDMERVVSQIYKEGRLSAQEIYNRNKTVGDVETIGRMIVLAERAGQIRREKDEDGVIWYVPGA